MSGAKAVCHCEGVGAPEETVDYIYVSRMGLHPFIAMLVRPFTQTPPRLTRASLAGVDRRWADES